MVSGSKLAEYSPKQGLSRDSVAAAVSLKKIKPLIGKVKLAEGRRLRFSADLTDNALDAIKHLVSPEASKEARWVIDVVRKKTLSLLHKEGSAEHMNDALLSVALKSVDADIGWLSGLYTLFNKLVLTTVDPEELRGVFGDRMTSWMLEEKSKPDQVALVKRWMPHVFALCVGKPRNTIDFKTFLLNRGLWATAGAVDVKELVMNGLQKTKAGVAFSMSDSDLWRWWLMNRDKQLEWSVVKKSEPGAVRLVVLTDLVSYLKMAYVAYHVEPMFSDHPYLYNYMGTEARHEWWMRLGSYLGNGYSFFQGDYSNFDASETIEALNTIRSMLQSSFSPDPEGKIDTLNAQMMNAIIHLPWGSFEVKNGLPSGSRDTTLLNSLLNICTILEVCDRLGIQVIAAGVLGDDSVILFSGSVSMDAFVRAFSGCGLDINPLKSKISSNEFEFLKMTMREGDRPRGNPIRAIRALLFSNESEADLASTVEKWQQRVTLWAKLLSRLQVSPEDRLHYILTDLNGATPKGERIKREHMVEWLATPSAMGGGGLLKETGTWMIPVPRKVKDETTTPAKRVPVKPRRIAALHWMSWKRGLDRRVEGLMTKRKKVEVKFSYVRHKITNLGDTGQSVLFQALTAPDLVHPRPNVSDYDDYTFTVDGIRSNKDANAIAQHFLTKPYDATLYNIYKRCLTLDILKDWLSNKPITPVPTFPVLTMLYGEVLDASVSNLMQRASMLSMPRKITRTWQTANALSWELAAPKLRNSMWL